MEMKKVEADDISEFRRGALSASLSILVAYPLNKLSIRQSLEGTGVLSAWRQMRFEGLRSLYRGIGPPLLQKTAAISMMYGCFSFYKKTYAALLPSLPPVALYILAGATSGSIELIFTPLERIQTLLTCPRHAAALPNMYSAAAYILRFYGVREFFRGWQATLVRNVISTSLFFYVRDRANALWPDTGRANLRNFVTGALLGCVITSLCFPINATRIFMQSELGGNKTRLLESFTRFVNQRERRLNKIYLGGGVNALRSLLSWGVINTTQQYLSKHNLF